MLLWYCDKIVRTLAIANQGTLLGSKAGQYSLSMTMRRTYSSLTFSSLVSRVSGLFAILVFALLLLPKSILANPVVSDCQVGLSGEYLRADGHANQPWSIKVSGQPVVYIEHCLMEQLLSFFPEKMRKRHFTSTDQSRPELQPAAWRTKEGLTILTLSPESRFQLATAILYVESLFHPNVSPSSAGAIGPFQVLPTTGDQMKLPQVDNPKVNLQAGLKYILFIEEQIAKHCDIDDRSKESSSHYRDLIAASYNAGPSVIYLLQRR